MKAEASCSWCNWFESFETSGQGAETEARTAAIDHDCGNPKNVEYKAVG